MDAGDAIGIDPVEDIPAVFLFGDQSSRAQNRQMLRHGRLRQREALPQVRGIHLAISQTFEYGASCRIGQGFKELSVTHADT